MENMEHQILDILNDPNKMAEIMELAKGLGLSPPQETETNEVADDIPQLAGALMGMLQDSAMKENRQDALVQALLPYLKPQRQKKLQKAMKLGKLSQVALIALKNYQDQW